MKLTRASLASLSLVLAAHLTGQAHLPVNRPVRTQAVTVPPESFVRGFSFSHEFNRRSEPAGYGSEVAHEQLKKLRTLNANAIALIPYGGTRPPESPLIRRFTAESDERIRVTARQARALGLRVMLKPQLWTRGFVGDIRFDDEEQFREWFAGYREWILHYAGLAREIDADLFVIGTELAGLTHHERAWRGLIGDIRGAYPGLLTYAAHWDREIEDLPFWDELDLIGLNMYAPLAEEGERPAPDSRRLQQMVRRLGALANRYGKTILFTEIGFPNTRTAASKPWEDRRAPADPEMQQASYVAVFEAFYNQPWCAGMYLWKWPSHGRGNLEDRSFFLPGKPALEVVRQWYRRPRTIQSMRNSPTDE